MNELFPSDGENITHWAILRLALLCIAAVRVRRGMKRLRRATVSLRETTGAGPLDPGSIISRGGGVARGGCLFIEGAEWWCAILLCFRRTADQGFFR